ncbi:MAG: hypothetical protein ACKO4Z_00245 [Planctomycetota bacterium]
MGRWAFGIDGRAAGICGLGICGLAWGICGRDCGIDGRAPIAGRAPPPPT